MAMVNALDDFLSSSEDEEEFWGFLPEEINKWRPSGKRSSSKEGKQTWQMQKLHEKWQARLFTICLCWLQ